MSNIGDMHPRRAQEALNALSALYSARSDFISAIIAVTDKYHGPQGVSGDMKFQSDVLALFDAHIDHIVRQHQRALAKATLLEDATSLSIRGEATNGDLYE